MAAREEWHVTLTTTYLRQRPSPTYGPTHQHVSHIAVWLPTGATAAQAVEASGMLGDLHPDAFQWELGVLAPERPSAGKVVEFGQQ